MVFVEKHDIGIGKVEQEHGNDAFVRLRGWEDTLLVTQDPQAELSRVQISMNVASQCHWSRRMHLRSMQRRVQV